jgi:hypothetical protein
MLASPVLAFPDGPDPDNGQPTFELFVRELQAPIGGKPVAPLPLDEFDRIVFQESQGWDFGDRTGYKCGWVEFFVAGNEKFEVHFELADYEFATELNDRFGAELPDPEVEALCGDGVQSNFAPDDGSDHFPHMIHAGDALRFYSDGEEIASIDLATTDCNGAYYTPGDEPGEAWLWWDQDGPTFSHGPGEGELNCNGGPGEPVKVARVYVKNADPDVGYCTDSMHDEADLCFNHEPPPTPVQLGSGTSVLTCPDASTPVVTQTDPLLVTCP